MHVIAFGILEKVRSLNVCSLRFVLNQVDYIIFAIKNTSCCIVTKINDSEMLRLISSHISYKFIAKIICIKARKSAVKGA